jgi:eukaryotic-like serine/threonine-protein kinase
VDVTSGCAAGTSLLVAVTGKLDRYRPISTLGAGGMGTVLLAEDELLGRRVALKRMNAGGDARGLSRLRREALVGASVSHSNLVSIYDIVTSEDGDQMIVMEYVRGEALSEALKRSGKLSESEALRVLVGVSSALDVIHRQGIVHRDVKPANILLADEGMVKLADLGIASTLDGTRITTSGAVLGSFRYMAPEQLEGNPSSPAIDIYALSAVAYEALSGCKARREPNPVALAHAIATQPPPDLRDVLPSVPVEVATLLSRGMARDPAMRPRTAGELVGRLRAALTPEAASPVVVSPPRRAVSAASAPTRREVTVPPARPEKVLSSARRDQGARPGGPAATYTTGRSRRPVAGALFGLAAVAAALAAILTSGSPQPGRQRSARSTPASQQKPVSVARGSTHAAGSGSTRAARHSLSRATSGTPSSGLAAPSTSPGSSSLGNPSASVAARATTSSSTPQSTPAAQSSGTSASAPASGPSGGPSTSAADSPISAVESFYGRAAAHQYAQAWALADPTFRNQLEGYDSFQAQQADDRSITFNGAQVLSKSSHAATVAVSTISVRADGTKHCSGTVDLSRADSSGGWLLHLIHINCS